MRGHTAMPTLTFEPGTDYDTLHSIVTGWCVKIWLVHGAIITAEWKGPSRDDDDMVDLVAFSNHSQGYDNPITIPMDDVIRVSVL
jgi:hypothetical protein